MGHKVHPIGFRLGVVKSWQSRWYAERDYKTLLAEDFKLRLQIQKELSNASISKIEIERAAANQVTIIIHTAKPGIVIGKSGEKVDRLRASLEKETKKRVRLNIIEIRQPELDAYLVGRSIAEQLEKRVSFRRAMKQAVQRTMRANAKGIRIVCGGRLGGAEIARTEKEIEGKIPLHTLRADIDYGLAEAHTTFGVIGIKVWIYKGDVLPSKRREATDAATEAPSSFTTHERADGGDRRNDRRPQRSGPRSDRPQGERGPRSGSDRPQGGDRAPRSDRPQGERAPRSGGDRPQGGDRGPRSDRPQGDRPPRPQGERAPRPQGDRPARPQGDRPPRPQGERAPRPPRAEKSDQVAETPQVPVSEPETQTPQTPPAAQVSQTPETGASESE